MAGLAALGWAGFAQAATVGFETVSVPVSGDRPLQVAIWYPSTTPEANEGVGLNTQLVARNGALAAGIHPLIVISHGTGGSNGDHFDTAQALARAGFVVAAVAHTGDTYDDRSRTLWIAQRPGQLTTAIDYMVKDWRAHATID